MKSKSNKKDQIPLESYKKERNIYNINNLNLKTITNQSNQPNKSQTDKEFQFATISNKPNNKTSHKSSSSTTILSTINEIQTLSQELDEEIHQNLKVLYEIYDKINENSGKIYINIQNLHEEIEKTQVKSKKPHQNEGEIMKEYLKLSNINFIYLSKFKSIVDDIYHSQINRNLYKKLKKLEDFLSFYMKNKENHHENHFQLQKKEENTSQSKVSLELKSLSIERLKSKLNQSKRNKNENISDINSYYINTSREKKEINNTNTNYFNLKANINIHNLQSKGISIKKENFLSNLNTLNSLNTYNTININTTNDEINSDHRKDRSNQFIFKKNMFKSLMMKKIKDSNKKRLLVDRIISFEIKKSSRKKENFGNSNVFSDEISIEIKGNAYNNRKKDYNFFSIKTITDLIQNENDEIEINFKIDSFSFSFNMNKSKTYHIPIEKYNVLYKKYIDKKNEYESIKETLLIENKDLKDELEKIDLKNQSLQQKYLGIKAELIKSKEIHETSKINTHFLEKTMFQIEEKLKKTNEENETYEKTINDYKRLVNDMENKKKDAKKTLFERSTFFELISDYKLKGEFEQLKTKNEVLLRKVADLNESNSKLSVDLLKSNEKNQKNEEKMKENENNKGKLGTYSVLINDMKISIEKKDKENKEKCERIKKLIRQVEDLEKKMKKKVFSIEEDCLLYDKVEELSFFSNLKNCFSEEKIKLQKENMKIEKIGRNLFEKLTYNNNYYKKRFFNMVFFIKLSKIRKNQLKIQGFGFDFIKTQEKHLQILDEDDIFIGIHNENQENDYKHELSSIDELIEIDNFNNIDDSLINHTNNTKQQQSTNQIQGRLTDKFTMINTRKLEVEEKRRHSDDLIKDLTSKIACLTGICQEKDKKIEKYKNKLSSNTNINEISDISNKTITNNESFNMY